MSNEQGPHFVGMRMSARAEGSLQSNGEPTGLLLARDAGRHRLAALGTLQSEKEVPV